MDIKQYQAIALPRSGAESTLASNRVIRNTYLLLSLTLLFSALTAGASVALTLPHPGIIITLVGYFGLLFAIHKMQNSGVAVGLVFAHRLHGLHTRPDHQPLSWPGQRR